MPDPKIITDDTLPTPDSLKPKTAPTKPNPIKAGSTWNVRDKDFKLPPGEMIEAIGSAQHIPDECKPLLIAFIKAMPEPKPRFLTIALVGNFQGHTAHLNLVVKPI